MSKTMSKKLICSMQIFVAYTANFNTKGLVETWLKDLMNISKLIELTNRQNKRGGGVCLCVDEKINYKVRND